MENKEIIPVKLERIEREKKIKDNLAKWGRTLEHNGYEEPYDAFYHTYNILDKDGRTIYQDVDMEFAELIAEADVPRDVADKLVCSIFGFDSISPDGSAYTEVEHGYDYTIGEFNVEVHTATVDGEKYYEVCLTIINNSLCLLFDMNDLVRDLEAEDNRERAGMNELKRKILEEANK